MNDSLSSYCRFMLKELLARCTEEQQLQFKRMYSHTNLDLPIDQVVDKMPVEKLDRALTQVQATLKVTKP